MNSGRHTFRNPHTAVFPLVTLFWPIDANYARLTFEQAANCPGRQFPSFSEFPRRVMLLQRGFQSDWVNAENLVDLFRVNDLFGLMNGLNGV